MSDFKAEVIRIGPIAPHPNADTLSITKVFAFPVIIKTGAFAEGDKAAYLPVDSVVSEGDARFSFLGNHRRIKAKRLRGVFSMGLLVRAELHWTVGQDVASELGVSKYEPPEPLHLGGENERPPFSFPKYTDIKAYRRYPDVLQQGEEVVVTEKIHGVNARIAYCKGRLWCGSHRAVLKQSPEVIWWKVAQAQSLESRLSSIEGMALYGEVYGDVQDLKYGLGKGELGFALFDALDLATLSYVGWDRTAELAETLGLPLVPVLYRGAWKPELLQLAEGKSALAAHLREGVVVRAVEERYEPSTERAMVKVTGEGYLLRKGGTEYH